VSEPARGAARRQGVVGPGPRAPSRLVVPDVLLVDGLAVLAGAATRADAVGALLPLLAGRPGVRATAVVTRSGRHAVIVGSAGYGCGEMSTGATLPLDAGLPVTEAVRTGRTVVQGAGPSWVAIPFGRGGQPPGALLLSLVAAPPETSSDLARLHRLSRALGDALHRCAEAERTRAELSAVTSALVPTAKADRSEGAGCDVVVRSRPRQGEVGGDVVVALPDGRGGCWLVAADVVGSGMAPALLARSTRAAVRAAAGWADGPAALLAVVEQGIAEDVPPGSFVTAVAVRVSNRELTVASAGHPAPLLVDGGGAVPIAVEPGAPLALETGSTPIRAETRARLDEGFAVLLHTDGLVERRGPGGVRLLEAALLALGLPRDLDAAADQLLAEADAVGPAEDDVSLLLARPRA
jgi:hypothetical protein